jgi:hypothetical protein
MIFFRAVFMGSIAAFAFFQASAVSGAETDSQFVWQFSRFKDAAAKNIDAAQLIYAIPETDAIQASATCNAGSAGKVSLSLSANVSVPDKTKLMVKIFNHPMNAIAIIPESGEGLAGFSLDISANDPLLAELAGSASLTYSLKGDAERTIPLSKGKVAIKKFIRACKSFAA